MDGVNCFCQKEQVYMYSRNENWSAMLITFSIQTTQMRRKVQVRCTFLCCGFSDETECKCYECYYKSEPTKASTWDDVHRLSAITQVMTLKSKGQVGSFKSSLYAKQVFCQSPCQGPCKLVSEVTSCQIYSIMYCHHALLQVPLGEAKMTLLVPGSEKCLHVSNLMERILLCQHGDI